MKDSDHKVTEARIGLFSMMPCIGIIHSIVSTAEILKERGYEVDIFTNIQTVAKELVPSDVFLIERNVPSYARRFPFNLIHFIIWALKQCHGKQYTCFIGYDPPGLIVASFLSMIYRVPTIYYSLELWVSKDLPSHWRKSKWLPSQQRLLKYAERIFHRKAEFTIIQDKRRARILFEDNHMVPGETYYVPHTGREKIYRLSDKPNYLRKKFFIDNSKIILLMIGGINDTTLALQTAVAASNWSNSCHLIIHGFSTPDYVDKMLQAIKSNNVTLSTNLVSISELSDLVASADIGLALYPNSGTNMYEMTSGKIGQYYRCGIPVIANNFPNLVGVVEASRSGICVPDVEAVPGAVDLVLKNYESFKENAFKAYHEFYDFDSAFEPVIKRIEDMDL